jgi:ABC-type glycerol-3-phosphate transport system substrate-binding protein
MNFSKVKADALNLISILTSADTQQTLSQALLMPPVRRDVLSSKPDSPFLSVFYDSALITKGWLDPNPDKTDAIFKSMIDQIVSGRKQPAEGIDEASDEIEELLVDFAQQVLQIQAQTQK